MIVGVGVDVVDVDRFAAAVQRTPRLNDRLFTPAERDLPLRSRAARFAAKEALAKALGAPVGLHWQDCEVLSETGGRPRLHTYGTVARAMAEQAVDIVHVTLSHDGGIATAMVIAESASEVRA